MMMITGFFNPPKDLEKRDLYNNIADAFIRLNKSRRAIGAERVVRNII